MSNRTVLILLLASVPILGWVGSGGVAGAVDHQPVYVSDNPQDGQKVGTFKRDKLLGAYYGSEAFDQFLRSLKGFHEAAKATGDSKLVEQIEKVGPATQEVAHLQLAGKAPLTNIFTQLEGVLPEVAKAAGVHTIFEEGRVKPGTQTVDVTQLLVSNLEPNRAPKKTPAQTPKSPELKVLDRFVGSFRDELVTRQANGDEEESTGTGVAKWSLQGQYLEQRATDSDGKQTALHLWTYDSDAGVYTSWTFFSNLPKPASSTWRWNESKKTFAGKGDLGNGITMQITLWRTGKDRFEFTATTKDASGNVLGETKGKAFRKKKSKL